MCPEHQEAQVQQTIHSWAHHGKMTEEQAKIKIFKTARGKKDSLPSKKSQSDLQLTSQQKQWKLEHDEKLQNDNFKVLKRNKYKPPFYTKKKKTFKNEDQKKFQTKKFWQNSSSVGYTKDPGKANYQLKYRQFLTYGVQLWFFDFMML